MYSQKFSEQEGSQGGGITKRKRKKERDAVDWKADCLGLPPMTMSLRSRQCKSLMKV